MSALLNKNAPPPPVKDMLNTFLLMVISAFETCSLRLILHHLGAYTGGYNRALT